MKTLRFISFVSVWVNYSGNLWIWSVAGVKTIKAGWAGRSRMSNLDQRGRKQRAGLCTIITLMHTHWQTHNSAKLLTHTTGLFGLLHLSYSNLRLIFSYSYLPEPTHNSPPVSLHFLLSSAEKYDQCWSRFEIKYESSQIKIQCLFIYYVGFFKFTVSHFLACVCCI